MVKKLFLAIFFLLFLFMTISCSQPQETLGLAILSVDQSKADLSYRFTAVRGEQSVSPVSCIQELGSLSSFSAGSYAPGLWTFAVCGFDGEENPVAFGKTTVYLSSGETSNIDVPIGPLSPAEGSASVSFTVETAAIEGEHCVSLVLLKDGVETVLSFDCISEGERVEMSSSESLESGIYTVSSDFSVDGNSYFSDVSLLRVFPDTQTEYFCLAEIRPAYTEIDFTDPRLDYGLNEGSDKICTGFRSVETGEEINLDEPYLSPVGSFWTTISDLGLEPIVSDMESAELESVRYLAIGPGATLSAEMFSNTSASHNASLSAVVCFASYVPSYCFSFCDSLEKICLKDGVTYVSARAFSSCQNLESVTIAPSVTTFKANCFSSCSKDILHVYVPFAKGSRPSGWLLTWASDLKAENIIYGYREAST